MPAGASPDTAPVILHATTIAHGGRAALIRGPSGAGKSGLALQLIALGACLVADDRTALRRQGEQVIAQAIPSIEGQIEARGVGILGVPVAGPTPVRLIVDLAETETERLPFCHEAPLLGLSFPLVRKIDAPHFTAAILLYLQGDRVA
jgi:HPr kinase/phosphorylase